MVVYRLVGRGTLDELIARIAAQKLALDRALKGGSSQGETSAFASPSKKSKAAETRSIGDALSLALGH